MSRTSIFRTIFGVLILSCLLWIFVVTPYQAWRQWNATRAALVAKGEKLSLADFPDPALRDEENFFADPIWRELSDRELAETNAGNIHASKLPEDQWQLGALRQKSDRAELEALRADFPEFRTPLANDERLSVLRKIWDQAAKKPEQSRRAAEITLRALGPGEPMIARIRELSQRPDASFPLAYEDGMAMRYEHAGILMAAGQWLELRTRALLELGDYRAAFQDTILIYRLAETLKRNPLYMTYLVDASLTDFFTTPIDRGIRIHAWTADELRAFDRMLAKVDAAKSLATALRMERAMMLDTGWTALGNTAKSGVDPSAGPLASAPFWFYRFVWMPGDKALYSEIMQKEVERLDAVPRQGMNPRFFSPNLVEDYLKKHPTYFVKLSKLVTVLTLPGPIGNAFQAARTQTIVNLTRTAISLELYHMEHGEYPETLAVLKPGAPDGIPLDLITGQVFRYTRNDDGSFSLWSVGWNEKDENGRIERKRTDGDWVWGA